MSVLQSITPRNVRPLAFAELQLKYGDDYSKRVAICAPTGIAATHIQGT
jgi:hypothetical protein